MSDHSLMNPDFLKKELEDCTTLYAETETFVRELEISTERITDILLNARHDQSNGNITLTADQVSEIAMFVGTVEIYKYRFTSPRQVMISHYKQLLKDRRYRIATKLLNLFK